MNNSNFLIDYCTNAKDVYLNVDRISETLIDNKVVGFKNISITDDEFGQIMLSLYRGTQEYSELNPGTIYDQNHQHDLNTLDDDIERFIYGRWHVDNPFYKEVSCYTGMRMRHFSCPESCGQTHFIQLSELYNNCPKEFIEKLKTTELISATGCLEENWHKIHPHPAIVKHPVTDENMIYWTGHDMRIDGEHKWFEDFKKWISEYVSSPKNRITWNWSEEDVLVWDNRAVAHSFSPGWTHEQRIFTRCEVGFEVPK